MVDLDSPVDSPVVSEKELTITNAQKLKKDNRRRKVKIKTRYDALDDSIDLTNSATTENEIPRKRSKRSADKFSKNAEDVIVLGESQPSQVPDILQTIRDSYEEKLAQPKTRGRKKANGGPKRLTYKQALKAMEPTTSKSPRKSPKKRTFPPVTSVVPQPSRSSSSAIDLTGEVELTDKHSSAPLFQKQVSQPISEPEKDMTDDSDIDLDLDLDVIKIKVKTDREIVIFPTRQHQNFHHIFSALGKKMNVPVSKIFIYNGDARVSCDDTPHSVNYKFSTILKMSVMKTEMRESLGAVTTKKDQIEIKFQWDKDRVDYRSARNKLENSMVIKVSKLDTFKTIVEMLGEKLKIDSSRISLSFDGDGVNINETPADLEFDGGETMDCKISSG